MRDPAVNFDIIGDMSHVETIARGTDIGELPTMNTRTQAADYVVCVDNSDYPASLELHKIYRMLPDEDARADGDLRIVDESGEDYLFPAGMFVPINPPDQVRSSLLRASSS